MHSSTCDCDPCYKSTMLALGALVGFVLLIAGLIYLVRMAN